MGDQLSIAVAIGAGLLSFLSPCVLPLVPAYLGQLGAVAVVGRSTGDLDRWLAVRHSLAYVVGFGVVFTVLGLTATYLAGPLVDALPLLRQVGGIVLVLLGLNLAGVLRIPALDRSWRPLDMGASGSVASATRTMALTSPGVAVGGAGPGLGERLGGRIVSAKGGWMASFGLGAIFAVGWTPCIGTILGAILFTAATTGSQAQGALLLVAYTAGLGIPFILLALAYDRAPGVIRPLLRHGRTVSLVGGILVALIGVAMIMDWLALLPQYVPFNTQI